MKLLEFIKHKGLLDEYSLLKKEDSKKYQKDRYQKEKDIRKIIYYERYRKGKPEKRKILQYNRNGDFIKEYNSVKEITNETGIDKAIIYNILNDRQKQTKGFVFRYKKTCNYI